MRIQSLVICTLLAGIFAIGCSSQASKADQPAPTPEPSAPDGIFDQILSIVPKEFHWVLYAEAHPDYREGSFKNALYRIYYILPESIVVGKSFGPETDQYLKKTSDGSFVTKYGAVLVARRVVVKNSVSEQGIVMPVLLLIKSKPPSQWYHPEYQNDTAELYQEMVKRGFDKLPEDSSSKPEKKPQPGDTNDKVIAHE